MICSRCHSEAIEYSTRHGLVVARCLSCGCGQASGTNTKGERVVMIHDPIEGRDILEIDGRRFWRPLSAVPPGG